MKRLTALLASSALCWAASSAQATITPVKVGALITNTNTSPATINVTSAVSVGDEIEFLISWPTTTISAITVSDNAGVSTGNCAGAYAQRANFLAGNRFMVYECKATIAMGTGPICGAGGATQCAFSVAWTTNSRFQGVVLDLTEAGNTIAYDSAGSGVSAQALTTGSPFSTGPTSPAFTGSDEYVVGLLSLTGTGYGAGSTLTALQNGYASLSAPAPVTSNGANLWAAGQALTSGTAQLNGTFNGVGTGTTTLTGIVFSFKATPSGAATPCYTNLLGAGKC